MTHLFPFRWKVLPLVPKSLWTDVPTWFLVSAGNFSVSSLTWDTETVVVLVLVPTKPVFWSGWSPPLAPMRTLTLTRALRVRFSPTERQVQLHLAPPCALLFFSAWSWFWRFFRLSSPLTTLLTTPTSTTAPMMPPTSSSTVKRLYASLKKRLEFLPPLILVIFLFNFCELVFSCRFESAHRKLLFLKPPSFLWIQKHLLVDLFIFYTANLPNTQFRGSCRWSNLRQGISLVFVLVVRNLQEQTRFCHHRIPSSKIKCRWGGNRPLDCRERGMQEILRSCFFLSQDEAFVVFTLVEFGYDGDAVLFCRIPPY